MVVQLVVSSHVCLCMWCAGYTLENRLCCNVEVIQHKCKRWRRRREAMAVKHDTFVRVSAQAACFNTNLWQQNISVGGSIRLSFLEQVSFTVAFSVHWALFNCELQCGIVFLSRKYEGHSKSDTVNNLLENANMVQRQSCCISINDIRKINTLRSI